MISLPYQRTDINSIQHCVPFFCQNLARTFIYRDSDSLLFDLRLLFALCQHWVFSFVDTTTILILAVVVSGKYLSHLKSYGCIYSILVCFQQFMYLLVSFIRINRGAIVWGARPAPPLSGYSYTSRARGQS